MGNIQNIKIVALPKILDARGNLSFVQNEDHYPFIAKRAYWIYDVPGGEVRGGHAFREQQEVIIALSGSLDVVVNDGNVSTRYSLNRSYTGLYIPKMLWRHMENFSTNAVALVISSTLFSIDDYIHNFDDFKRIKNGE